MTYTEELAAELSRGSTKRQHKDRRFALILRLSSLIAQGDSHRSLRNSPSLCFSSKKLEQFGLQRWQGSSKSHAPVGNLFEKLKSPPPGTTTRTWPAFASGLSGSNVISLLPPSRAFETDIKNKRGYFVYMIQAICRLPNSQFTLNFASWSDRDPTKILPGCERIAQCEPLLESRPDQSRRSGAWRRHPWWVRENPDMLEFCGRRKPAGKIRSPGRSRGHFTWWFQPISTCTVQHTYRIFKIENLQHHFSYPHQIHVAHEGKLQISRYVWPDVAMGCGKSRSLINKLPVSSRHKSEVWSWSCCAGKAWVGQCELAITQSGNTQPGISQIS